MAKRKKGSPVVVPERSLDCSTLRLRDVVLIYVDVIGGKPFDAFMTRVPTAGEETQHEPIDSKWYARLG